MNDSETKSGLAPTPGYRYAKVTGDQLHVAGQVPRDSAGNIVGIDDPYAQVLQCLTNLKILMSCYDFSAGDVQHLTIYVVGSRNDLAAAWEAVLEEFSTDVPPASLIGVSALGHDKQMVEIDATIIKAAG